MNQIMPRTVESGSTRMPLGNPPLPKRPVPITRAPDREKTHMEKDKPTGPVFTLYIDSVNCPYSRELLHLVKYDHKIQCLVVDISVEKTPSWMTGTPNIVVGTDVYCGDTAFKYVNSYGQEETSSSNTGSSVENIVSGKTKKDNTKGCGLSDAFSQPVQLDDAELEKKHSASLESVMSRMMADRG